MIVEHKIVEHKRTKISQTEFFDKIIINITNDKIEFTDGDKKSFETPKNLNFSNIQSLDINVYEYYLFDKESIFNNIEITQGEHQHAKITAFPPHTIAIWPANEFTGGYLFAIHLLVSLMKSLKIHDGQDINIIINRREIIKNSGKNTTEQIVNINGINKLIKVLATDEDKEQKEKEEKEEQEEEDTLKELKSIIQSLPPADPSKGYITIKVDDTKSKPLDLASSITELDKLLSNNKENMKNQIKEIEQKTKEVQKKIKDVQDYKKKEELKEQENLAYQKSLREEKENEGPHKKLIKNIQAIIMESFLLIQKQQQNPQQNSEYKETIEALKDKYVNYRHGETDEKRTERLLKFSQEEIKNELKIIQDIKHTIELQQNQNNTNEEQKAPGNDKIINKQSQDKLTVIESLVLSKLNELSLLQEEQQEIMNKIINNGEIHDIYNKIINNEIKNEDILGMCIQAADKEQNPPQDIPAPQGPKIEGISAPENDSRKIDLQKKWLDIINELPKLGENKKRIENWIEGMNEEQLSTTYKEITKDLFGINSDKVFEIYIKNTQKELTEEKNQNIYDPDETMKSDILKELDGLTEDEKKNIMDSIIKAHIIAEIYEKVKNNSISRDDNGNISMENISSTIEKAKLEKENRIEKEKEEDEKEQTRIREEKEKRIKEETSRKERLEKRKIEEAEQKRIQDAAAALEAQNKAKEAELEQNKAKEAELEQNKAKEAKLEQNKAKEAELEQKKVEEAKLEQKKVEETEIKKMGSKNNILIVFVFGGGVILLVLVLAFYKPKDPQSNRIRSKNKK